LYWLTDGAASFDAWLPLLRPAFAVLALAALWCWESWRPFFRVERGRLRHAARNLGLALTNRLLLFAAFGTATVAVTEWSAFHQLGMLPALGWPWPVRTVAAFLLLDAWTYLWHRANHRIPFLWRFHRMHHADGRMDVTTATRFHLGELAASASLRLGLIPLAGFAVEDLMLYDAVLLAVTQLHHANISLGRWDRPLRWLMVTPDMHKVHHSRLRPETDSNYASVLSVWDRIAGTFRARPDPATIDFGLEDFDDPKWQTLAGMWLTPFTSSTNLPTTEPETQATDLG
jgi:sterol desaturase/sphingolipid hydroxylase (fatty acid hydroxylase superfamily)